MQNLFKIIKSKTKIKKNAEIIALGLLLLITIIFTTYYNYSKQKIFNNYKNTINNVYLKKTIKHILDNLEPRFKKVRHTVLSGETFDSILESYFVSKEEINIIKNKLEKKININKLNTDQKFDFIIDQTNNEIKEFTFKISNTEKIFLIKNDQTSKFELKNIITKLKKDIIYKENLILQSL